MLPLAQTARVAWTYVFGGPDGAPCTTCETRSEVGPAKSPSLSSTHWAKPSSANSASSTATSVREMLDSCTPRHGRTVGEKIDDQTKISCPVMALARAPASTAAATAARPLAWLIGRARVAMYMSVSLSAPSTRTASRSLSRRQAVGVNRLRRSRERGHHLAGEHLRRPRHRRRVRAPPGPSRRSGTPRRTRSPRASAGSRR